MLRVNVTWNRRRVGLVGIERKRRRVHFLRLVLQLEGSALIALRMSALRLVNMLNSLLCRRCLPRVLFEDFSRLASSEARAPLTGSKVPAAVSGLLWTHFPLRWHRYLPSSSSSNSIRIEPDNELLRSTQSECLVIRRISASLLSLSLLSTLDEWP